MIKLFFGKIGLQKKDQYLSFWEKSIKYDL